MKDRMLESSVVVNINRSDILKVSHYFSYPVKIVKQDKKEMVIKILEKDLHILNNNQIKYKIVGYKGLIRYYLLLVKNMSIVCGVIIFLILLYLNTLTIKDITFSAETTENEKIRQMIEDNLNSYYGVKFLGNDIRDINLQLRKEFSDFEWVSVQKTGCVLEVTILQPTIINKKVEHIEGYGDLVAEKDALIKFFKVSHGIPQVYVNQFVKAGDVLVSGNLRSYDLSQAPFYIPASGEVYAEVWYTETVTVPKKLVENELTGRVFTEKGLNFFGIDLYYKRFHDEFSEYETEESLEQLKIFDLTLPFGIKKIHYLEKNDIISIYDESTSFEYAESSVRYEIKQDFNSEDDEILQIELISSREDDDSYTYVFFIKTYEDIAKFQRRNMNE